MTMDGEDYGPRVKHVPTSAQATGRDGAALPVNEHVCGCGHVESAHLYDGQGECKLMACGCKVFSRAVYKPTDPQEALATALAGANIPPAATKDTNPKDAVGTGKAPISTVSAPVIAEVGLAMLEGARKYGRHNYRVAGVRASVYFDAVNRHLGSFWEGEDVDPDSGLSHITKAIASLVVLRDSMIQGNWIDDRPPPSPSGWLAELNKKAAAIVAKYPDAREAFLATDTPADVERKLKK
jgi:hypothetical protein